MFVVNSSDFLMKSGKTSSYFLHLAGGLMKEKVAPLRSALIELCSTVQDLQ